jgi:3'-5' exoribonuclease
MLTAVRGAPAWLGLREPRSIEAEILSMADRLSGHEDLHHRCAPEAGSGFGDYHPHLKYQTYVTAEAVG